jgi:hypothetical protein
MESYWKSLTPGGRVTIRLTALAAVNATAYVLYVSAIRAAKKNHVKYMGEDGSTNYDAAVSRAYKEYFHTIPGSSEEEGAMETHEDSNSAPAEKSKEAY